MEFNVGDLVLLLTKTLLVHGKCKLVPRWIGPFPIEACVGWLVYRLTLPAMYRHLHPVFHISKLKHILVEVGMAEIVRLLRLLLTGIMNMK